MYGNASAYVKVPEKVGGTTFMQRNGCSLKIQVTKAGTWVEAVRYSPEGGKIVEYLYSPLTPDQKPHIFTLTDRKTQGKVSILDVLKRHQVYPNGKRVRI